MAVQMWPFSPAFRLQFKAEEQTKAKNPVPLSEELAAYIFFIHRGASFQKIGLDFEPAGWQTVGQVPGMGTWLPAGGVEDLMRL